MKPERQWFALHSDSTITALGECADYQSADEVAQNLGLDPMWLIDPEMARQWVDTFKTMEVK